ncbi:MAG TPA: TetR/AcrR family transcriptional regulator [Acidimicrobiales bacterium]|nr:TetR/AcrR family transcriptional regulator [Acidimicrobiales bacterium]
MVVTADIEGSDLDDEGQSHRRPGRPRDPDYDKVILNATLEILFEKGYAGLTIGGVAARSGVGRPTIYRRWSSKPELVVAAMAQSGNLSRIPDTGSLRDDLLAFQRQQVRVMDSPESRRITAGLVADLVANPELAEPYFGDYIEPRRMSVWEALQRGIDRGELRADADFTLIYDLLLGPLFIRSVVRGESLGAHLADQTVDLVLAAFGTATAGRRGRDFSSPRSAQAPAASVERQKR